MPGIRSLFIVMGCAVLFYSCQKQDVDIPENKVPVADAGPSLAITLPVDFTTLNGSGTDADGKIVAYLWSQVAGPDATSIVNPGAASTEIKNFTRGTYIFQVMVTDDKGDTGVDTVSVLVNPSAVQTLSLQPDNNPTEFQITNYNGQDLSGAGGPEISIDAWTKNGNAWTLRNILKFDLSSIPGNAVISSANLYLYSNPNPGTGNLVDANFGTNNSMFVQQVTSGWDPATVGWFNQPSSSSVNQIPIPSISQSFLDLNIDVTNLVTSMVKGNANYGFLLKLQNEVMYNSRIFVSSYNVTYPAKHPRLVVVYKP